MLVIGLLVVALFFAKRHKVEEAPATAPPPLLVSHSGQGSAFRSVADAIRMAKDKDHILVSQILSYRGKIRVTNVVPGLQKDYRQARNG